MDVREIRKIADAVSKMPKGEVDKIGISMAVGQQLRVHGHAVGSQSEFKRNVANVCRALARRKKGRTLPKPEGPKQDSLF